MKYCHANNINMIGSLPRRSQQGMILVMISIILVIVGFSIFSSLVKTRSDLAITSSNKDALKIFNCSEFTIGLAEKNLIEGVDQRPEGDLTVDAKVDWKSDDVKQFVKDTEGEDGDCPDYYTGEYYIQYLGRSSVKNESINEEPIGDDVGFKKDFYLVTARNSDVEKGVTREVQTVYSKLSE